MPELPAKVREAWDNREGPIVLATVDNSGRPNIIYATCVAAFGNSQLVVADNFFDKTRKNIKAGCSGAVLFITKQGKAYQAKGPLTYHTEGPVFDAMKTWHNPKHPGVAATALKVEEFYSGAERFV